MTFHDLRAKPPESREEHLATWPLHPQALPRTLYLGGVECKTEMVKVEDLVKWRRERGLEFVETCFVARVGRVNLYWPSGQ